ncbi:MAG: mercuric transport protein MerTP [Bacteroidetes bacterium]|nr:MAG: mercuric transport protein MerTP [Bacteroidota bacterium]
MKKKSGKALIGSGIITAIAASLCCITPILALVAGGSGIASSFTWLEPLRPYLIGFTILVIGFAWYQKLKAVKQDEIECACETDEQPNFWQSRKFLGMVTVFAALMLAFPYYSGVFFPNQDKEVVVINALNIEIIHLDVEGMTCPACNFEVNHAVTDVDGVFDAETDYKTGKSEVKFDKTKTTREEVINSINKNTPYKVRN